MNLIFSPNAWAEYTGWLQRDRVVLKKVNTLITEILRDPFTGTGKPEPLKNDLAGYWSRRITQEHRLVYTVHDDAIIVVKVGKHYQ